MYSFFPGKYSLGNKQVYDGQPIREAYFGKVRVRVDGPAVNPPVVFLAQHVHVRLRSHTAARQDRYFAELHGVGKSFHECNVSAVGCNKLLCSVLERKANLVRLEQPSVEVCHDGQSYVLLLRRQAHPPAECALDVSRQDVTQHGKVGAKPGSLSAHDLPVVSDGYGCHVFGQLHKSR